MGGVNRVLIGHLLHVHWIKCLGLLFFLDGGIWASGTMSEADPARRQRQHWKWESERRRKTAAQEVASLSWKFGLLEASL